jgi:hypothetical protein
VLNADELMRAIAHGIRPGRQKPGPAGHARGHQQFSARSGQQGKDVVLIIDEAQNLTDELLEQVRLLSNIELDDRKLLQIVLMGQPELRDRLNSPRLRQLAPAHHGALSSRAADRAEVVQYIQHRLELAGAKGVPISPAAGVLAGFRLQPRHSPAGQRHLRQGVARRFCRTQRPHQLPAWWAAPSANSKGGISTLERGSKPRPSVAGTGS